MQQIIKVLQFISLHTISLFSPMKNDTGNYLYLILHSL